MLGQPVSRRLGILEAASDDFEPKQSRSEHSACRTTIRLAETDVDLRLASAHADHTGERADRDFGSHSMDRLQDRDCIAT